MILRCEQNIGAISIRDAVANRDETREVGSSECPRAKSPDQREQVQPVSDKDGNKRLDSHVLSNVLCCSLLFSASFTAAHVDSGQNSVVGGSIAGLEFEPNSGFVAPEKHADP
jgi:hypothetical protein